MNGWLEGWRSACLAVNYRTAKCSDPPLSVEFLDKLQEEVEKRIVDGALTISPARACMKVIDACQRDGIPFPPSFLRHKDELWAEEREESEIVN